MVYHLLEGSYPRETIMKGDSSDVLHLPVELEVALPPDNLVMPLYHSARKGYDIY